MKPVHTFTVIPDLPRPLAPLRTLAYNLRWSWHRDTLQLFRRLDPDLWETTGHNPVLLLGTVDQARLEEAAQDEGFLTHLARVREDFETYLGREDTWFQRAHRAPQGEGQGSVQPLASSPSSLVAYFSAEFGLTDCLTIFAGGLGLLAGDHLKSASDLGVPLVGVGLLYQQGYFRQYLNEAGWQQEAYETNDFHTLPLTLIQARDGSPVSVTVDFPSSTACAQLWRADVGRVPLYLLDTNIATNHPAERDITDQLYGGDSDLRIRQEMLLGIGGYRALMAMGLDPPVVHMNEGHSAFLALERIRQLMQKHGASFWEAREAASAGLIFTTHTPVPAGHDRYRPEQLLHYLGGFAQEFGLAPQEFLGLGRVNPADGSEEFCMTTLALRLASHSNAVSALHGHVTRRMWQSLWPGVPEHEIPIGHVTNGVHLPSWVSPEMNQLYERYLGMGWDGEPAAPARWQRVARIPADELWSAHCRRRERLVSFTRQRLRAQLVRRTASRTDAEVADEVLDPDALTIGFARRFATYKRATLLLRDPARLARILNDPQRPVQVVFAGKAHPRDDPGKELIRRVIEMARQDTFRRRIVFLEDYDTSAARYLVQGADVWLNTPRRLFEASGTSGMKATANGALNLSTLDGWWDEAWPALDSAAPAGWAIGRREAYDDPEYQDQVEAEALYHLLEQEVVPTYYDRGPDGVPRRWIAAMKASIAGLCHTFNTHRMVEEYVERFYVAEAPNVGRLSTDNLAAARTLAAWRARIEAGWGGVRIELLVPPQTELPVGKALCVNARVTLGSVSPQDVAVELCEGRVGPLGEVAEPQIASMSRLPSSGSAGSGHNGPSSEVVAIQEGGASPPEGRAYLYGGQVTPQRRSGTHGLTARVRPQHELLGSGFIPGLVVWAQECQAQPELTR